MCRKTVLLFSIFLMTVFAAYGQTSSSLPELRAEDFFNCDNGDCYPELVYDRLEKLGFKHCDNGLYHMERKDVGASVNTEWEAMTVVLEFTSEDDAKKFMTTFDDLWKDKNGFKGDNLKSAGRKRDDLCVERTGKVVWIGYVFMFKTASSKKTSRGKSRRRR